MEHNNLYHWHLCFSPSLPGALTVDVRFSITKARNRMTIQRHFSLPKSAYFMVP